MVYAYLAKINKRWLAIPLCSALAGIVAYLIRDQRIDGIEIFCAAHLGDHDLVEPVARLFEQVHHVAIPVGGIKAVDPHRQGLLAPVDVADGLNDVVAGAVLVGGRNAVLEVEVDDVRRRAGHLLEDRGARAWAEQLAAVRTGGGAGDKGLVAAT